MNIQKFESMIERIPFSGCWVWVGPLGNSGYGRVSDGGIRRLAHRVSFEHFNLKSADGMNVCHRCDNPPCVNPEHLFLGTQKQNLEDMRSKNRQVNPPAKRGEAHYEGKLTDKKVIEIRNKYTGKRGEIKSFALFYGVSTGMISHIVKNMKWTHLLGKDKAA